MLENMTKPRVTSHSWRKVEPEDGIEPVIACVLPQLSLYEAVPQEIS